MNTNKNKTVTFYHFLMCASNAVDVAEKSGGNRGM